MRTRQHQEVVEFRFKWLDEQGQEVGFVRLPGRLDAEHLELEEFEFPLPVLRQITTSGRDLRLAACPKDGEPIDLRMRLWGTEPGLVKRFIDRHVSQILAAEHWRQLQSDGRDHEYRERDCPACGSTIVLTGFVETPQVFCHHCESLSVVDSATEVEANSAYGICDECGLFSQPKSYTAFYFYFLFVEYGFHVSRFWRCPACMRAEAWKMIFLNAPFIVGLPWASWQLGRSYMSSWIKGPYRYLDAANLRCRQGRLDSAVDLYLAIVEEVPYCAGIKCNLADGFMAAGDRQRAEKLYLESLADCANYFPAKHGLEQCRQEELKVLAKS